LIQSIRVYTLVSRFSGLVDIVKAPIITVIRIRIARSDFKRRCSLPSFPPQGSVHLSIRFTFAEEQNVPSNILKVEGQGQLDRVPDGGAMAYVATGGTVNASEQGRQTLPWHQ
jgi:hypothetical protein